MGVTSIILQSLMYFAVYETYSSLLSSYPLATKSLTAAAVCALAELISQLSNIKKNDESNNENENNSQNAKEKKILDGRRLKLMALFGLIYR